MLDLPFTRAGPWCLYDCWGIDTSAPLVPVWFPPPGENYPGTATDYVTGTCGNQYLANGLDSLTECGYAQHGSEKFLQTYTTSFTADAKRVLPPVNVYIQSPPSSCTVATCASFPNKVHQRWLRRCISRATRACLAAVRHRHHSYLALTATCQLFHHNQSLDVLKRCDRLQPFVLHDAASWSH